MIFHENPSIWSLAAAFGRTDRRTDITKLKVVFSQFLRRSGNNDIFMSKSPGSNPTGRGKGVCQCLCVPTGYCRQPTVVFNDLGFGVGVKNPIYSNDAAIPGSERE